MEKKVVILGGGVAGMSAAHELIERGYKVEIFEKNPEYVGGKARSIDYYGEENNYESPLPGEHGFRFFPGFYKHITDTMQRTPYQGDKTCYDNLVASKTAMMASFGKPELLTLVNFPKSINDLETMLDSFIEASKITDLEPGDSRFFASKLWELATSSVERRADQLEKISWMDFTEGMKRSAAYRQYFVVGLTRTLVAAKANEVSTKTGGNTLLQLIFLMLNPKSHADRVLNKPTNEAWLYPWRDLLLSKGVVYNYACETKLIHLENNKITKATIQKADGSTILIEADYFICAMPVERMNELLFPELIAAAPSLAGIPELAGDVSWMTGIQFFLNEDVKLNFGHTIYTDSPWALTSISQPQFWSDYSLEGRGNGKVKGILSIDISDWFTKGLNGKLASQCDTKEEIKEEVWHELELSLNDNGQTIISKDMIEDYYLDRDIKFQGNMKTSNEEPLLVNKINTWHLRPKAETEIPNLLLASDYVQTYTDLATMEGANEAARSAVNSILQKDNFTGEKCGIWKLKEPDLLRVHRWFDEIRYKKGLPWYGPKLPFPYNLLNFGNAMYLIARDFIKKLF